MVRKKKRVAKKVRRVSRRGVSHKKSWRSGSDQMRINLALKNLVLFFILFAAASLISKFASNSLLINLMDILSIIFSVVTIAFILVYLILIFLRVLRK